MTYWTFEHFVSGALVRSLGRGIFLALGGPLEPVRRGAGVLMVLWLVLYWMQRRRIVLCI